MLHRPNPALIEGRLQSALDEILTPLQQHLSSPFLEFAVRLYDGWFHDDGTPTELYEMVRRVVRSTYPRRKRSARIFVEVATALVSLPEHRVVETVRKGRGLGRYPVHIERPPANCARPDSGCGALKLKRWFAHGCPENSCPVNSASVASFKYQKLVDTSLVSDLIWLSRETKTICVVSSDEDMLPGLITAARSGANVIWMAGALPVKEHYLPLVQTAGVEVLS